MKKVLFAVTVVILLAAFCVSGFMVFNYYREGQANQERNDQLAQIVEQAQAAAATATTQAPTVPDETTPETTADTTPTEPVFLPGYDQLYAENPHMVGWLEIENTKIKYPVMQTPDEPNYYLYRDFDGNNSSRGSLYVRETCDVFTPSDNCTIYGHNMKDGSMFAALNAYTNKSAWERNSIIAFNNLYEYHTYQIFAVFKTSANLGEGFAYHRFENAANAAEFDEFVSTCKELSFYDTGITPKYGDKLICLSTCEYTLDNGRLVVAAVRIA